MIRNHSSRRSGTTSHANANANASLAVAIFFVLASGMLLAEAFNFPEVVHITTRERCSWQDSAPVQTKSLLNACKDDNHNHNHNHGGLSCLRDGDKRHESATTILPSNTNTNISIGDRFSVLARKQNAALLAVAVAVVSLVVVSTPALAVAEPPPATLVVSSSFRDSPLVVAVAQSSSPYTGQLVDTANARLVKLDSGVTYRDLVEGTAGDGVAEEGKRLNIQWSLKRSNGYSIDSSALNDGVPFIFVVGGDGKQQQQQQQQQPQTQTPAMTAIPGLDEGIRGMKVGGIRRIVIPPSLSYLGGLEPNSPGPVPTGFGPKQRIKRVMENRLDVPDESFLLDVKLTRVQ